jgi:hypothetical protein
MTHSRTLLAVTCSALATVAVLAADNPLPSAVGAALPCESNPVQTNPPVAPPTNLRIIGGEFAPEQEPWDSEGASGPYVGEESALGTGDVMAMAEGPHDYYQTLASRGDCLIAYSLRNQTQINQYRTAKNEPSQVNYLWPNDPDPRRQDAAKIEITGNNLKTQVWLPVNVYSGTKALITWDAWFGREFDYSNTGIPTYKTFQFGSPAENIWSEVRNRFSKAQGTDIAEIDGRYYGDSSMRGPNLTDNDPLSPQAGSFTIKPETWTRYWGLFEPGSGGWDLYSLWVADENTGPVQIFDRLQLKYRQGKMGIFRFEYNTSTTGAPPGRGPLIGYVRNFVVLNNPSSLSTIFQKPVR